MNQEIVRDYGFSIYIFFKEKIKKSLSQFNFVPTILGFCSQPWEVCCLGMILVPPLVLPSHYRCIFIYNLHWLLSHVFDLL